MLHSNSRIESIARPVPDRHIREQRIRETFSQLEEVEVCNCFMTWDDVSVPCVIADSLLSGYDPKTGV